MTSLDTESLPIAASVVHGTGDVELEAFRNATAAGALLRLAAVRGAFEAHGLDDDAALQLDLLYNWLLALPAARVRGICEEPAFSIWLRDAERSASGDVSALEPVELVRLLPYVFLRNLPEIAPSRAWTLLIPPTGRLMPIGLGFRVVPSQAHTMNASFRFSKGAFELALADGRHAQFTRIDNFGLAIERSDPGLTMPRCWTFLGIELYDAETFPELGRVNADGSALTANLVDVGDYLARAMSVLIDAWPACIPDIVTVFRAVIALDAPSGRVFSASSDKAPFVMQLTIRENEWRVVLAEMIVHESAHLKLHLLTTLDPLVVDNGERRFTHPWRTDLRPITGVLFGAHAFLNVLVMYEHAAYNGVEPKFAANEARLRRAEVHDALATLGRNARFTSAGAELYTDMCRVAGFEP